MKAIRLAKISKPENIASSYSSASIKELIASITQQETDCEDSVNSIPFSHIVSEGDIVLVKPNWVLEKKL